MNAMSGLGPLMGGQTSSADVVSLKGDNITLLRHGREEDARRAFSCLVEPEPGDRVLVGSDDGRLYVIAVLERCGAAPMRVAVPDGARIGAEGGRLTIAADTLAMEAETTRLATQGLDVAAKRIDAQLGCVGIFAEAIETIAERVLGRFRRSFRFVSDSEQVRARDIDQRASGHMHLRGDAMTLKGGTITKVQAKQIHLG